MNNIDGVILDLDGTLIDTNELHAQAWLDVLGEFGYQSSYEEVRRLIGMGSDNFLESLLGLSPDDPQSKEIASRRSEIFKTRYLPGARPFPCVRELLQRMKDEELRLVVGSSSTTDELQQMLRVIDATDLTDDFTSSDDAPRSKPDPDIVAVALEKLDASPDRVIMIGDSPYDVEAAHKAGIGIIALRCGGFTDADLAGALVIYDDPAHLLECFDDSALVRRQM